MADQSVAEMHLGVIIDAQLRLALFNLAMAAKRFLDVSHEFDGDHRYVDSEFFAALDARTGEALEVLGGLPSGRPRLSRQLRDRLRATFAKLRADYDEMLVDAVSGEYQRGLDHGVRLERNAIGSFYAALFKRAPFSVSDMLSDIRRGHHAESAAQLAALQTYRRTGPCELGSCSLGDRCPCAAADGLHLDPASQRARALAHEGCGCVLEPVMTVPVDLGPLHALSLGPEPTTVAEWIEQSNRTGILEFRLLLAIGTEKEREASHLRRLIHELVAATCAQGYWHGYSAEEDIQHLLDRVRYLESRLPSNRCASVGPEGQRCERPAGHGGQCGSNETGLSTWK